MRVWKLAQRASHSAGLNREPACSQRDHAGPGAPRQLCRLLACSEGRGTHTGGGRGLSPSLLLPFVLICVTWQPHQAGGGWGSRGHAGGQSRRLPASPSLAPLSSFVTRVPSASVTSSPACPSQALAGPSGNSRHMGPQGRHVPPYFPNQWVYHTRVAEGLSQRQSLYQLQPSVWAPPGSLWSPPAYVHSSLLRVQSAQRPRTGAEGVRSLPSNKPI